MPAQAMEILRYFLRNRQAADTLEGVARWRLTEERVYRSVEEVDRALNWLVSKEFLLKECAKSADPTFRLNGERDGEARGFVKPAAAPKTRQKQRN